MEVREIPGAAGLQGDWQKIATALLDDLGDHVAAQGFPTWVEVIEDDRMRLLHDPVGFFGCRAPATSKALAVVATAKIHAEESPVELPVPIRPGTTSGVRICCLVARDGQVGWRMVLPGGACFDGAPSEGRMLDCLRRALDLPTPPAPVDAGHLQSILWLAAILERAYAEDRQLSWREVAKLHPLADVLPTTGEPFSPADIPQLARLAGKVWTWERIRLAALRREWFFDDLEPEIAGWMDEGMFARWILGELPGTDELITRLRPHLAPSTARRLAHAVRAAA